MTKQKNNVNGAEMANRINTKTIKKGKEKEQKKPIIDYSDKIDFSKNQKRLVLGGLVCAMCITAIISFFVGQYLGSYQQELIYMHRNMIEKNNYSICYKQVEEQEGNLGNVEFYYINPDSAIQDKTLREAEKQLEENSQYRLPTTTTNIKNIVVVTVPENNPLRKPDEEQQNRIAEMIRKDREAREKRLSASTTLNTVTTTTLSREQIEKIREDRLNALRERDRRESN